MFFTLFMMHEFGTNWSKYKKNYDNTYEIISYMTIGNGLYCLYVYIKRNHMNDCSIASLTVAYSILYFHSFVCHTMLQNNLTTGMNQWRYFVILWRFYQLQTFWKTICYVIFILISNVLLRNLLKWQYLYWFNMFNIWFNIFFCCNFNFSKKENHEKINQFLQWFSLR